MAHATGVTATSPRLVEAATDDPIDAALTAQLATTAPSALLTERSRPALERLQHHLADPMATNSRAAYTAWLRRQLAGWAALRLPAVAVAAPSWPLSSVRAQCLDVAGLIIADLRELTPQTRPTILPTQATSCAPVGAGAGAVVGAADLCVRAAGPASRLLGPARALTEGLTRTGSATRYLARCEELAAGADGLAREVDAWAAEAAPAAVHLALQTSSTLAERLADTLEAGVRRGW